MLLPGLISDKRHNENKETRKRSHESGKGCDESQQKNLPQEQK